MHQMISQSSGEDNKPIGTSHPAAWMFEDGGSICGYLLAARWSR